MFLSYFVLIYKRRQKAEISAGSAGPHLVCAIGSCQSRYFSVRLKIQFYVHVKDLQNKMLV